MAQQRPMIRVGASDRFLGAAARVRREPVEPSQQTGTAEIIHPEVRPTLADLRDR
jgi:hypothetical protein